MQCIPENVKSYHLDQVNKFKTCNKIRYSVLPVGTSRFWRFAYTQLPVLVAAVVLVVTQQTFPVALLDGVITDSKPLLCSSSHFCTNFLPVYAVEIEDPFTTWFDVIAFQNHAK